jgi:hypothetical protein
MNLNQQRRADLERGDQAPTATQQARSASTYEPNTKTSPAAHTASKDQYAKVVVIKSNEENLATADAKRGLPLQPSILLGDIRTTINLVGQDLGKIAKLLPLSGNSQMALSGTLAFSYGSALAFDTQAVIGFSAIFFGQYTTAFKSNRHSRVIGCMSGTLYSKPSLIHF